MSFMKINIFLYLGKQYIKKMKEAVMIYKLCSYSFFYIKKKKREKVGGRCLSCVYFCLFLTLLHYVCLVQQVGI